MLVVVVVVAVVVMVVVVVVKHRHQTSEPRSLLAVGMAYYLVSSSYGNGLID
jgi:hypothetical protein